MTKRNPISDCLSHLQPLLTRAKADGLIEAALWVDDSKMTMLHGSPEWCWANGARQFLWQLADELIGVAPWSTDMHSAMLSTRPLLVSKRGTKLVALAIYNIEVWRHAESLQPVCFEPDVWQPLPRPPK